MARQITYSYEDAPTLLNFANSRTNTRVLMGPFGSGKSSACVMELLQLAAGQEPNDEGVRKTRWVVVRNTYRQLIDTTQKTFFDWVPIGDCGTFKVTDHQYIIDKIPGPDNTKMEIEVLFRALDRPEHVRNLLSMEVTGAWLNELREIPRIIWDAMDGRVGRYPSMKDGGATWSGIIADTNPCDTDHWIYKLFFEQMPNDVAMQGKYEFFSQPSGLSKEAENLKFLKKDYYKNMCIGKSPEFIKVYVEGMFGYVRDGKPVFPNYNDAFHLAPEPLEAKRGVPLILAFDFGLTPAVVFCQQMANGRFNVLRELCGKDIGLKRFVTDVVRPFLFANFHGLPIVATGDPAGVRRNDDESTAYMILKSLGINARPAQTNSFVARYNSVDGLLMKLLDQRGAFQLDSRCVMLHKGFLGEYKFRRIRVSHDDKFVDMPDKNDYSHPHDALQYAAMLAEHGMQQVRSVYGGGTTAEYSPEPPMSAWM